MRDPNRVLWNEQQKALQALLRPARIAAEDHLKAIDLFLSQHAMVHTAGMSGAGLWSLEDEAWGDLPDEAARRIPPKGMHSIAWMIWHIARIEDITMNRLVAGTPQLFETEGWQARLNAPIRDTASALDTAGVARLSEALDIAALRAYRCAVGRRTREIARQIQPGALKKKVDPARIQQVKDDGAVDPAAGWLTDYWGGLTIAGLLLMPPTRHNFVHLNEAERARGKRD